MRLSCQETMEICRDSSSLCSLSPFSARLQCFGWHHVLMSNFVPLWVELYRMKWKVVFLSSRWMTCFLEFAKEWNVQWKPDPLGLKMSYSKSNAQFVFACYPFLSLKCEIIHACAQVHVTCYKERRRCKTKNGWRVRRKLYYFNCLWNMSQ